MRIFRWGPLLVSLAALAGAIVYTRSQPALEQDHLVGLLAAFVWAVSALLIFLGQAGRTLAERLSALRPKQWLLIAALLAVLGVGVLTGAVSKVQAIPVLIGLHWALAMSSPRLFPLVFGLLAVLTWALLYGSLTLIASLPALARWPPLTPLARQVYWNNLKLIQFDPECAEFDPELLYLLRPGTCVYRSSEFTTAYSINSLGVRDDEASLDAPRLVLLGDSFSMGWGVEQDETYAQLLERRLGYRTLNAAVSSYGTVRELKLLARVDRSRLEALVIQYCDNDADENAAFRRQGNRLQPSRPEAYLRSVEHNSRAERFQPLRPLRFVFERLLAPQLLDSLRRLGWPPPAGRIETRPVDDFLNALEHSPVDLSRLRIFVLQLSAHSWGPSPFLKLLAERIRRLPPSDYRSRIEIVDVAAKLDSDDFFLLDDHITPEGHRKAADLLAAQIASPRAPAAP